MDVVEAEDSLSRSRPPTLAVLGLLALTAVILSYLIAYAVMNALVAAEVVPTWPREHDPRPRLFIGSFAGLMALFGLIAAAARFLSTRHLQRIDAMQEDDA